MQFYLLWGILFINVTAGIGILAQASPMMQDMFRKTRAAGGGASSRSSACSMREAVSSGRRAPISSGGATLILRVLRGAVCSVSAHSGLGGAAGTGDFLRPASSLFSRCMAAVSPPSPRSWRICSGPTMWARFMGRSYGLERRGGRGSGDHHRAYPTAPRPLCAPGASKVHIYDKPLEVLAALLALGSCSRFWCGRWRRQTH